MREVLFLLSLTLRKPWRRKVTQTAKVPWLGSREQEFELRKPYSEILVHPLVKAEMYLGNKMTFHGDMSNKNHKMSINRPKIKHKLLIVILIVHWGGGRKKYIYIPHHRYILLFF